MKHGWRHHQHDEENEVRSKTYEVITKRTGVFFQMVSDLVEPVADHPGAN